MYFFINHGNCSIWLYSHQGQAHSSSGCLFSKNKLNSCFETSLCNITHSLYSISSPIHQELLASMPYFFAHLKIWFPYDSNLLCFPLLLWKLETLLFPFSSTLSMLSVCLVGFFEVLKNVYHCLHTCQNILLVQHVVQCTWYEANLHCWLSWLLKS